MQICNRRIKIKQSKNYLNNIKVNDIEIRWKEKLQPPPNKTLLLLSHALSFFFIIMKLCSWSSSNFMHWRITEAKIKSSTHKFLFQLPNLIFWDLTCNFNVKEIYPWSRSNNISSVSAPIISKKDKNATALSIISSP